MSVSPVNDEEPGLTVIDHNLIHHQFRYPFAKPESLLNKLGAYCFAEQLHLTWLKGINEAAGKTSTSFKAWLTEVHYVFQNPTPSSAHLFYTADQNALT